MLYEVITPPDRGSIKPEKTCATFCHGKAFFPETVSYKGMELPHSMHVEEMEVGCESCHTVSEHGKTKIDNDKCSECHDF